jgi:PAS domain S-box-containing protein
LASAPDARRADFVALALQVSFAVSAAVYLLHLYFAVQGADLRMALVDVGIIALAVALARATRAPFRANAAEAALRDSEAQLRVLLTLSEAARSAATAEDVITASMEVLGKHLRASRCAYAHVDADGETFTVPRDYVNGCRSSAGRYRLGDFGRWAATEIRAGRTLILRDAARELSAADGAETFLANDIRALICCSLVRDGRLLAMIGVHQITPRDWTAAEIELLQAAVERCWAAVDRREYEERLHFREQHLRAVIDTTPECVALIAADGTIREMNPVGLALKEADSAADILGKHFGLLVAPEDRERVAAFHEAVCAGRGGRIVFDIVGLRGTRRTMETIGAPLAGADGRIMNLAIARDATETRRLEEQLRHSQKMEAIGRLAGGIAHDFNNLLTVVIGYCELLAEKNVLPPGDRELLDEVRKSGERAATLTRQLLAFSRKQVLAPRVLSLNTTVAEMERMLRRLIGEDVGLTCNLGDGLWPVKVDPGQIEQLLVNLAVNARDAMPDGGRLIIETKNVEFREEQCRGYSDREAGRYAAVSVSDTGGGIAANVIERIFEPFFTTKAAGKGTGLGLSVVHGIVKQSDGFIEVHSEPGRGASFVVYFPVAAGPIEPMPAPAVAASAPRGNETVLLVEDEQPVRQLLRRVLGEHGYDVIAAADGREALQAVTARGARADLVVTDIVMPRMSGRELVDALRKPLPALRALFISGYTDDSGVRHGALDARSSFLQKPFTPVALIEKVRAALDASEIGPRVLLVDDEAALVYLAARALEERGYGVTGCSSGAEALAAFKRDPLAFDLLVTDARMQGMQGLEVVLELRALRPELRALVLSGAVDDELRSRAAAAGARVVAKPSGGAELGALIDEVARAIG